MPQTRSTTRGLRTASSSATTAPVPPADQKRRAASPSPVRAGGRSAKRPKAVQVQSAARPLVAPPPPPPPPPGQSEQPALPAVLSFSFDDAKAHLSAVDPRFGELFGRLKCKPFEYLDQVNPFRSLVQTIVGQQISWLAARSVVYKFIRLYDLSLPEKPTDDDFLRIKLPGAFFPVPYQVVNTDVATLKSAGLSMRKAEYVQDLASRFADGRLSTAKVLDADDEELVQMLTEVRGIGKWTVDMFAIFTLRRPNILPLGDLAVQKGMIRWFGGADVKHRSENQGAKGGPKAGKGSKRAQSSGSANSRGIERVTTTSNVKPSGEEANNGTSTPLGGANMAVDTLSGEEEPGAAAVDGVLPTLVHNNAPGAEDQVNGSAVPEDLSSIPPMAPLTSQKLSGPSSTPGSLLPIPAFPQPFTPSINKVLEDVVTEDSTTGTLKPWTKSLPQGLTPAILKNRLDGKKVKGAFLTPQEMEALAAEWAPYRSLGAYYMWALTE